RVALGDRGGVGDRDQWCGVVVDDRAHGLAVGDRRPRRARQVEGERLVRFGPGVPVDVDGHDLGHVAGGERHRGRGQRGVVAVGGGGRPVGGGGGDGHGGGARLREAYDEAGGGRPRVALAHRGVGHAELRVGGGVGDRPGAGGAAGGDGGV